MKKIIIILVCLLLTFIVLYICLYNTNKSNIENKQDPVFYFSIKHANDGGSTIYDVLFYKIIKYKNIYNDDCLYVIGNYKLEFENPFYNENSPYFISE